MWTDKLAVMERDAVRQKMALKDRIRQALNSGNYVEAGQIQLQLREWEQQFATTRVRGDNGSIPEYKEY